MSKGRALTNEQFEAVKLLKNAGVKNKKIAEALGLGASTIDVLVSHDTLEDYKAWRRDKSNKYNAKKEAIGQKAVETVTVTLPPEATIEQTQVVLQLVKNIAETSQEINQRLDRIEESIEFLTNHTPVSTKRWGIR